MTSIIRCAVFSSYLTMLASPDSPGAASVELASSPGQAYCFRFLIIPTSSVYSHTWLHINLSVNI